MGEGERGRGVGEWVSEAWASDEELQRLPALDILLAFEDYARVQEREFEDRVRREAVEKTRKERKAREGFKVYQILFHWI